MRLSARDETLIFQDKKTFHCVICDTHLMKINNIRHKWMSGAQNNSTVGQQYLQPSYEAPTQQRATQNKIRQHQHGHQSQRKTFSGSPSK